MPEQPDFNITARIPGEKDASNGNAEWWSDLILEVGKIGGSNYRLDLTRPAGEAIVDALHEVLHPWAGQSIIEHIWSELVVTIDSLMTGDPDDEERGYARGLATAIAYLYNPLDPDVDAVRSEAMERWQMQQPADLPFG